MDLHMSSIVDQLKQLVDLQKLDTQILDLRRRLEEHPVRMAQWKAAYEQHAQAFQAQEARYKAMEVKRNQMEIDLAEREEQIRKLQVQLFQLKSNKEYAALQKEIEEKKADKSVLEEGILTLMEETDRMKVDLARAKEELQRLHAELQANLHVLEEEAKRLEEALQGLKATRSDLSAKVDPEVLSQYERILERKGGLALVPIEGNACGGCHMNLPPQLIVEVQMGKRLVTCESCSRILFMELGS